MNTSATAQLGAAQISSPEIVSDTTCFVERSTVRMIMLARNDDLGLKAVDELRIYTAEDFRVEAATPPVSYEELRNAYSDFVVKNYGLTHSHSPTAVFAKAMLESFDIRRKGGGVSHSSAATAIAALADRFWSVHPKEIQDLGITRQQFYEREMQSLFAGLVAPAQPSAEPLSALAGMFSESAHETWTKDEIVNIIEDAIRMGSAPSSTNSARPVGWGGHLPGKIEP